MTAPPTLLALLLCAPPTGLAAEFNNGPDASAVLARWEAATAGRIPVSAADRAADRLARPDAPQELLDLAADLRGPVSAADLAERYDWRVIAAGGRGAFLAASPRDPLARAFTAELSVASVGGAPLSVTTGERRSAAPWPVYVTETAHVVLLDAPAAGAFAAPARPARLVRRADYVIRGQSPDPGEPYEPSVRRRPPVKTALYVRPAGDAPTWRLDRRLKRVPTTQLVVDRAARRPLVAPKPR